MKYIPEANAGQIIKSRQREILRHKKARFRRNTLCISRKQQRINGGKYPMYAADDLSGARL